MLMLALDYPLYVYCVKLIEVLINKSHCVYVRGGKITTWSKKDTLVSEVSYYGSSRGSDYFP